METKINWEDSEYPETHDFEVDPIIEGTLISRGDLVIRDNDASFVVLETAKGERTVWLGAVLKSSLKDKGAEVGSYIGIKYLGMKKSAGGFNYRNYTVRVISAEVA